MKTLAPLFLILFSSFASAQCTLEYEFVDSSDRSKDDIYSLTKAFIAYTWNDANAVIMNDDKEKGIIIVKGTHPINCTFMMNRYEFRYKFTTTFRMKDNKVKMNIDNVVCDGATLHNQYLHQTPCIPALKYNCIDLSNALYHYNLPKKYVTEVAVNLNSELKFFSLSYKKYIKTEKKVDDW